MCLKVHHRLELCELIGSLVFGTEESGYLSAQSDGNIRLVIYGMSEIEEKHIPASIKVRGIAKRLLSHENAVLILVLIALIGGLAIITKGLTANRANILNILLQSSIRGVAAVGQAFVILTAGIDLSVGGVGLFSSMLGTTLISLNPELSIVSPPFSIYSAIPIMLLAAFGWGTINGSLVSRVGMPPLIVTLGMWEITKGMAFEVSRGHPIRDLPESLSFFGSGIIAGIPVPVIIFITVAAVGYFVLNHTVFGKSVYAVGGNPLAAWLAGTKVRNILLSVYMIAGFLAGLCGLIMAARAMSSSMLSLRGLELDCIASVVVGGVSLAGGRGSLIGVVIGSIIIGVVNNGMATLGAGPSVQAIVKGMIIFTAVAIDYLRRR